MDQSTRKPGFVSSYKDKALFTPGPLSTSQAVKQAMLRDLGSRDLEFMQVVREIREKLAALGSCKQDLFTTVLTPGSGTFTVESVVSSTVPQGGKLLVLINGAYGRRIAQIAEVLKIEKTILEFSENQKIDVASVEKELKNDSRITNVAVVHCETTSGIINPIEAIGSLCKQYQKTYFVDAMSSFGAVPVDMELAHIDYLVSSANKCIEGVPGFGFALCRKQSLQNCEGVARSLSLDLYAQWKGLETTGQFRFTPPTHTLLAFRQALAELEQEGGVQARSRRYQQNYTHLVSGMRKMGFREFLKPEDQGYIITSFYCPTDSKFKFETFYEKLSENGFVIYPGKVGKADCFRIGNIGRIAVADISGLLHSIKNVMDEMGVQNA